MQQQIDTTTSIMPVFPARAAETSAAGKISWYRVARLLIFLALAAFWVAVFRAVF